LWPDAIEEADLAAAGFGDPAATSKRLLELRDSGRVRLLQGVARTRLDAFMPRLIAAAIAGPEPDQLLERLLPLVNAVLRRSAYLALLLENPGALGQLVRLCSASPWIADQLARNPVLLDELLDARTLYTAPEKQRLQSELQQQLARVAVDDQEAQLEALRYFKASQTLRVAACEISGQLPLMKVSDNLTFIAEVILDHAIELAWRDLCNRFGEPDRGEESDLRFAIVAYGKLGGLELGYSSDLDLVFIFDADPGKYTNGERQIDNTLFYTRLGQRIIHILTTRTAMGELYEIDMRLRPSGESGMLVASLNAYRDYQTKTAWTWEHQALVRARVVAGSARLGALLREVREQVLARPRDAAKLATEVTEMRDRMREHKLPKNLVESDQFHLKQGVGGIVDIEFMVQYAVLAWSQKYPSLSRWTDNIRILEALGEEGLFTMAECESLTEAYISYRSRAHQMALLQHEAVVEAADLVDQVTAVINKWTQLFTNQE
jgi:glutamate-ammonia-ligase adenylyltransferase